MSDTARMSIRSAAQRYGVSARTLRFYEEAGLLDSHRAPDSRYREYDDMQLQRIEWILLLRRLSFSVEDIGHLLKGSDMADILAQRVTASDRQLLEIREANQLLHALQAALPERKLSVKSMLESLVYLTQRMERMNIMQPIEQEAYRIALGLHIVADAVNVGDLVGRIKAMRVQQPSMPSLRVYDDAGIAGGEAVIYWAGRQVWKAVFTSGTDAAGVIIAQLDTLLQAKG